MSRCRLVWSVMVAAHLVLVACSGPLREDEDSATVGDAANGETNTADAPSSAPSMASCDQVTVRTVATSTYVLTTTTWYADIAVPGFDPRFNHVSVVFCDDEVFGTGVSTCPVGATCANTGYSVPVLTCRDGTYASATGRIVVNCGYRTQMHMLSGTDPDADNGLRARVAYVRTD